MEETEIRAAAPITFLNVLLLTIIFCVIDEIRRIWMVKRPVKQIREGMNKIIAGDFQMRIPYIKGENSNNEFDDIIKGLNEMTMELSGVETLRTDLISNILKLNRLENQQIYPDKKEYNLTEQICECLLVFEHAWEEKQLEIETDLEEDIIINQDAQLLSLVWNNLFSNAIKFNKNGGKVEVKVKGENGNIYVTVRDNGCGISQETGRHIFEKFYQGDTSHATQGNGLGLALVKRVIDIVGGDITVQSALGEGTTFCVCLKEKN